MVHQLLLDGVQAALYTNADGEANFDVLAIESDEEDTASTPFNLDSLPMMSLRRISLGVRQATWLDARGGTEAKAREVEVEAEGEVNEGKAELKLAVEGERVEVNLRDSVGAAALQAALEGLELKVSGQGDMEALQARVKVEVARGAASVGGVEMVSEKLSASKKGLLSVDLPCQVGLTQMKVKIGEEARVRLADYGLLLSGNARLASDSEPLAVDARVQSDGEWSMGELLQVVPQEYVAALSDIDIDGLASFEATAVGVLTDSTMPLVEARLQLADGQLYYPQALSYRVKDIAGKASARLDLGRGGQSSASVEGLRLRVGDSKLTLNGQADDLLGDMAVRAAIDGELSLADAEPMLPAELHLAASGLAEVKADVQGKLADVQRMALEKVRAAVRLRADAARVALDSLRAEASGLEVEVEIPARQHKGKWADVKLKGDGVKVATEGVRASLEKPDIALGVNNPLKEQLAAECSVSLGEVEAMVDSMVASIGGLELKGAVRMDSAQSNVLRRFNPEADVEMHSVAFYTPSLPDALRMQQFALQYDAKRCNISTAELRVGHSDFQLYGSVDNLEEWLEHKALLHGDVNFNSGYADIDQLMDMFSGMGSDTDTLERMRQEDQVPAEANPFIVPRDVDFTLHTHIKRSVAFGNDLNDVAGSVTIKDGVAVLDQIGFVCKAATMQLTALYKSPRPNNLFCALDFHLLDIQVDELIDMIPMVDTLVPMLAALEGKANFHLAAETFLDAQYRPKMSSLLGSAAISGRDLTVMDNSTISTVAKLMQLKSWKERDNKIRVDSIDVELTCLRKEIEVFPFILHVGKYQLCASGKHTLDNQCGYHVELLKNPLLAKVGVDIRGDIAHPKVSLGQVRYADLYKPEKQGVVEKRTLELKRMIREALEANVR